MNTYCMPTWSSELAPVTSHYGTFPYFLFLFHLFPCELGRVPTACQTLTPPVNSLSLAQPCKSDNTINSFTEKAQRGGATGSKSTQLIAAETAGPDPRALESNVPNRCTPCPHQPTQAGYFSLLHPQSPAQGLTHSRCSKKTLSEAGEMAQCEKVRAAKSDNLRGERSKA